MMGLTVSMVPRVLLEAQGPRVPPEQLVQRDQQVLPGRLDLTGLQEQQVLQESPERRGQQVPLDQRDQLVALGR